MKVFTGLAIGALAVIGAVAGAAIYLKKKTEKEQLEYDKFDDIMDEDMDFDSFFDEDDEIIDDAAEEIEATVTDTAEKISDVIEEVKADNE